MCRQSWKSTNTSPERKDDSHVLLASGFEPFGKFGVNPSWEALKHLDGAEIGNVRVRTVLLPVEYGNAVHRLRAAIAGTGAAAVVSFGAAAGTTFRLEQYARNRIALRADNAGLSQESIPLATQAETLPATVSLAAVHAALEEAAIPASFSDDAGEYVCNHLYCHLLDAAAHLRIPAAFVHVPPPGEGIAAADLRRGIETVLKTVGGTIA